MKNSTICPKCNNSDIIRVEGKAEAYGTGNNIMCGMTTFSAVGVHRYLCCTCGFIEEWVDLKDIEKIKKHNQSKGEL